ncbi:hypothetical protein BH11PSE4_BH11PSE4_21480 [soil metagenome]
MARKVAAAGWRLAHALTWAARRCAAPLLAAIVLLVSQAAQAQAVRGEASLAVSGGYARLVLKLSEDVESEVATAGTILVVRFKRPVDIAVDGLADAAPDYVGSARRDPDGMAVRLALSRKVTVNTMVAGERIFIDLLPDKWAGPPPSLPQEVIRELSERARAAERQLRMQRSASDGKKMPMIRVRAAVQPTFVRFVFDLPEGVNVSSTLDEKRLALTFTPGLTFDLADAKLSAPTNVASIGQASDRSRSAVEFALIGEVDVHSFRQDKSYVVDIGFQPKEKPVAAAKLPGTVPAAAKSGSGTDHGEDHAPAEHASTIVPPTSESIAREAAPVKMTEVAEKSAPAAHAELAKKDAAIPEAAKSEVAKPEPAKPEPAKPEAAKPETVKAEPDKIEPAKAEPAKTEAAKPEQAAVPAKPAAPELPLAAMTEPKPAAAEPTPAAEAGMPVEAIRSSDGLRLNFAFAEPTPVALFRRNDIIWLVVDSNKPIDLAAIRRGGSTIIAEASRIALAKGQAIRMRLNRPQLASLTADDPAGKGQSWSVMFADTRQTPSQPLIAIRNIADPAHANVSVPLSQPGVKHRLVDPDTGDALTVVTALPPPRGVIRRQDFVEFALLETIHGLVVQLNADDVVVDVGTDKVSLSRPGGLTLSPADASPQRASLAVLPIFDVGRWRKDQEGKFTDRLDEFINAASQAEGDARIPAQIDLARFYMARGMYQEAKGAADLALLGAKPGEENAVALIVRAVASALMGRPAQTLKDIANPVLGPGYDAELWKGLAYADQGKWVQAREKFKNAELAIASLPPDLQRVAISSALRASLEVKDYAGAVARGSELELVGIPKEMKPRSLVMSARLDEALGRDKDALSKYQEVIGSGDRQAAAEAKLRELQLREKRHEIKPEDVLRDLETLAVMWRGDGIEVQTLQRLSKLYSELGRYRESLGAARLATERDPNSEAARQVQDEASALFSEIYLGPKGDGLPPIDALAMFYEFRELTPIGRRGDEMIRRLADRLVAVDLLDQAAELLQYQVDRRLEGAARAQVASRLAMVYLMARKPDRAIAALRTTRIGDLNGELRQQRLLLEARAQSDVGRRDLALDIIANIPGREAIRLRSDIYWSARRWREASEQIELYYGDRWRDFTPLNTQEKSDVIRAVVGYALAEDALGLARFRDKFAPLMTEAADKTAFDTASKPTSANSSEFAAIAKIAASVDTLDGFLNEMKARFPDNSNRPPSAPGAAAEAESTGSLPPVVNVRKIQMTR